MILYDKATNLPTLPMWRATSVVKNNNIHGLQACVTSVQNQNLTTDQKELLCWHYKLCHTGFDGLQQLLQTCALGQSPLLHAASTCLIPKCAS